MKKLKINLDRTNIKSENIAINTRVLNKNMEENKINLY
jgi:hypothetical protein